MRARLFHMLALVLAHSAVAQPVPSLVRTLGPAEGLSQSSVQVMLQDRQGLMWLGTQDGLDRYDGYTIVTYRADPLDSTALQGSSITALLEGRDGSLWVGTDGGGLSRLNRASNRFQTWRHEPTDTLGLSSDYIYGLAESDDGTIWVATSDAGLQTIDSAGRIRQMPGAPPWLFDIAWQSGVGLWLATDGEGLELYRPEDESLVSVWPAPEEDVIPVVLDLHVTDRGVLWAATVEGLIRVDTSSLTAEMVALSEGPEPVLFAVREDGAGRIWAGSAEQGVFMLRAGNDAFPTASPESVERMSEAQAYSILEDRSGLVWLGTESRGALLFGQSGISLGAVSAATGYPEFRDTWSVAEASDGTIWAGVGAGGLARWSPDSGTAEAFPLPEAPEGAVVLALHAHANGEIWGAVDTGGMFRVQADGTTLFDPLTEYLAADDSSDAVVLKIFEAKDGTLWMGTGGWGLYRMPPGSAVEDRERIEVAPDSLQDFNVIYDISQDVRGRLWLATDGGIVRFDPDSGSIRRIASNAVDVGGLASATLLSLRTDDRDRLWVGTGNGLFWLESEQLDAEVPEFDRIDETDGLPNYVVYSALPDSTGWIWMSTNRGLAAFHPESRVVRSFDDSDGLPGLEYNSGAHAIGASGRLYFGGIDGLSIVPAAPEPPSRFDPPLVITRASTYGGPVATDLAEGALLELRYPDRSVALEVAALDFARPGRIRYAYRLSPLDPDWIDLGIERTARFANLAPGTYTFQVRATNADGVPGTNVATTTLRIVPRIWQTAWFRLLIGVLLVAAVTVGARRWYRARMAVQSARIGAQQRMNERLESERLRLARDLHDGPIQDLQLVGFELRSLAHALDEEGVRTVDKAWEAVRATIADLRGVCSDLRPPALVHFGLGRAIRSHAERFLDHHPEVSIDLAVADDGLLMSERNRLNVFRIYQEAMRNVAKHAGPCSVQVRLEHGDGYVRLEVKDDGPGFSPRISAGPVGERRHFGLIGMIERAESIGGQATIDARPGEGTRVRVQAPYGEN